MIELSIITPCYNEEGNLTLCVERTLEVMTKELPGVSFEHIFCDNYSIDGSFNELKKLSARYSHVKVIRNSRNIGPFRNMYRGLEASTGKAIIPMLPADLQDPPEVIPLFYKEWKKGFHVVFGERTNRKESFLMRILRSIYYRIIRRFAEGEIPMNSGEFMLIDRSVADPIIALDDNYPYIRGLVAQSTTNSSSIPYTWGKRVIGKSKNNFFSLLDQAINGFISTSRVPARIMLVTGFMISFLGILGGVVSFILALISNQGVQRGVPTLIVILFIFGGLQLFFIGLVGEYVISIHSQVRRLPRSFDLESINFEKLDNENRNE